jgi:hypothetical protein
MQDSNETSFVVDISRLTDYERHCYGIVERNPVIAWLEENVGPSILPHVWPHTGRGWKCWMVFDPRQDFAIQYCEVNFTNEVDDSIISMFVLRWM